MEKQTKEVALQPNAQSEVEKFNFFNPAQFEVMQRISKMFASSELVPDMYRATDKNSLEKAMANCMIAIEIAQRTGASPLMVMQNMYIVYGKPAWSSKFLIATINTCGRFNPLQFKFNDLGKVGKVSGTDYQVDDIECIAFTTSRTSKDILEGSPVSVKMAILEGWYTKNGSKWKTLTRQMLMYRAASFWTNAYAPELSMGMKTEYEVYDIEDVEYEDVSTKANKQVISMTTADDAPEYKTTPPTPVEGKTEEPEEKPEEKPEAPATTDPTPKMDF